MTQIAQIFLVACVLIATPEILLAANEPSLVEPGTLEGEYYFYTFSKNASGQPTCSESWLFNDNSLTISPGPNASTKPYRLELREFYNKLSKQSGTNSWLIITDAANDVLNGCLAGQSIRASKGERGFLVYHAPDKGIVICVQPAFYIECFGHFYRAADVDGAR